MPVNLVITISLVGALVLVLLKRRSLAAMRPATPKRGGFRTGLLRPRAGRKRTETAEVPAIPRMRPRLAMTESPAETAAPGHAVDGELEPPAEEIATTDAPTADLPAASLPESLWDDTEPGPEVAATADPVPSMLSLVDTSALVDAPGWPSPGELVGVFALDDFDPLPPGIENSSYPEDLPDSDHGGLWRDLDGSEEPQPDLPIETWGRNPYVDETGVEPDLARAPLATLEQAAWDEVADSSNLESAADAETPGWASDNWSFEGQDQVGHNAAWTDPDPADDSPAVETDAWDAPAQDATGRHDDAVAPEWSPISGPTPGTFATAVSTHPLGTAVPHPNGQAPVVVVLTPEMLDMCRPSARERELERTVRRLEKIVATLTAAAPVASTPRTKNPSRTTPPRRTADSAPTSTSAISLTATELTALRALAARRSAPVAARNRARIIMRSARGQSVATIANAVGVTESTVRRWQARFADNRLAALGSDIRP